MPAMAQIQEEQRHIVERITKITGLPSRWSGRVVESTLVDIFGSPIYAGAKDWSCDILLHQSILNTVRRYSTAVHEGFHSVSVGLEAVAYNELRGFEEGVVEQCTRIFREEILYGLKMDEPLETRSSYGFYVSLLEDLRSKTAKEARDFYVDLLHVPLSKREETVVQWLKEAQYDIGYNVLETLRLLKERY